jgi:hypothetical protein
MESTATGTDDSSTAATTEATSSDDKTGAAATEATRAKRVARVKVEERMVKEAEVGEVGVGEGDEVEDEG